MGTLARAPLGGGVPREILEFVETADWTPDGKDLAIVRFVGGENRLEFPIGKVLYQSPRSLFTPRFSPKGDRIAFYERGGTLYVTDLAGKLTKIAGPGLHGISLAWAPSGEIWTDDRSAQGEGQILAFDSTGRRRVLARAPGRLIPYDVAADGRALIEHAGSRGTVVGLAPGEPKERDLSWYDSTNPVGLSADGKTALLTERGAASQMVPSFYLRKLDGSPAVKLGEGDARDLSPDGKWVLVRRDQGKGLRLVPTGTGDAVELPMGSLQLVTHGSFLDDGRRVLIHGKEAEGKEGFYLQDIPAGKPRRIADGLGYAGRPVSPDGRWLVAFPPEWKQDLLLVPVDGGLTRSIPKTNTLDIVRWSNDGKTVLGMEVGSVSARVFRVDVETGKRELWKELGPSDLSGVINNSGVLITPDEKGYVYGYLSSVNSDLYMVNGLK